MKRSFVAIVLFCLAAIVPAFATHIVGGELLYDYLGKDAGGRNIYGVTLKVFRDCGPNTALFDGIGPSPAYMTVLDADGISHGVYDIGMPVVTLVPPALNSACMTVPEDVCVELGTYTYTITLEPRAGGYYLIYQRCCRNHSILNLAIPGNQGASYYAFIPGPEVAEINSSPRFVNYPPIFLCNGFDFAYTQTATDPDGDQLVYKFTTPFQGLDVCCPSLNSFPSGSNCDNPPPNCPTQAPPIPYPSVTYLSPYSAAYPAPANPSLAINPVTGAMSGAPSLIGQFVVSVSVDEYRNGVLLSRHFRDFQFNMLQCGGVLSQFYAPEKCQGLNYNFTNTSFNGSKFFWDFGVGNTAADTSWQPNPTYTYPDTGVFTVRLIVNRGEACSDTAEKVVRVYPPLDVTFEPPEAQCQLQNSYSFKTGGTYAAMTTFQWDFTGSAEPPLATVRDPEKIHFKTSGTFFIKLLAKHFACTDSIVDTLRVLPMPAVEIADPGLLCEPATATLRNKIEVDTPLEVAWRLNDGRISHDPEPIFTFEKAATYTAELVGTAFGKCRDTSSIKFLVDKKPVSGFEVYPKKVTVLEPEISVKSIVKEAVHFVYTFGDGSTEDFVSGKHSYYNEGQYVITQYVVNYFGCVDSMSQMVTVLPEHRFWIPNVFTPDGNSVNDTFGPVIIGVSHYSLEIFDRWGGIVFHSNDPAKGWDGKERGRECPQGTYAYKLSFRNTVDGTPVERLGHVTLVRNY